MHARPDQPLTPNYYVHDTLTSVGLADAALDRSHRLAARVRQLETRLSQLLGEKAWHASGFGAPADIDELHRKVSRLEQAQIDLTAQLDERAEELRAAREANRELNQRHLRVPWSACRRRRPADSGGTIGAAPAACRCGHRVCARWSRVPRCGYPGDLVSSAASDRAAFSSSGAWPTRSR